MRKTATANTMLKIYDHNHKLGKRNCVENDTFRAPTFVENMAAENENHVEDMRIGKPNCMENNAFREPESVKNTAPEGENHVENTPVGRPNCVENMSFRGHKIVENIGLDMPHSCGNPSLELR